MEQNTRKWKQLIRLVRSGNSSAIEIREVSCMLVAPGASFGELALIQENSIRNASIITDVPCNFMVIDRGLYNRSLKVNLYIDASF